MIRSYSVLLATALSIGACAPQSQLNKTPFGEWHHAGGNHFSAKYSPLDQIDSSNFAELEVAWDWQSADSRIPRSLASNTSPYRATPLFVNGVMYTNTSLGQVAALDPVSGEELWVFDPESYRLTIGRGASSTRGIEYWTDGEIERIFIATRGKQLVSIDIRTGLPDTNFGDSGFVDLRGDFGKSADEFNLDNITHG